MRVFIPTVTAGAGHLQAAAALEEAWRALRPADEVRRVDVLDYTPRWYRKIYVQGYLQAHPARAGSPSQSEAGAFAFHAGRRSR